MQVQLARPQDALNSYEQAIKVYDQILKLAAKDLQVLTNKGNVLAKQGNLQARLVNFSEALQSYEQAIAAFDQALTIAPNEVNVHKNKGKVLQELGFWQARRLLHLKLSENREALQSWQAAVVEFSCYLMIATHDNDIHNRRDLLQKLLDSLVRSRLSTPENALAKRGVSPSPKLK